MPVHFFSANLAWGGAAWLIQGDTPTPIAAPAARFSLPAIEGHAVNCACCAPRGPVAAALTHLFLARARGDVTFFRAVIALPQDQAGAAAIRSALATDPMLAARFRLETG